MHSIWEITKERLKLLQFYKTNILYAELQSHNIWKKLKNHMTPNISSHLHISGLNLVKHEFHHIVIKFHHKIALAIWYQSSPTASGGLFFVAYKKYIFLDMSVKLVLKN